MRSTNEVEDGGDAGKEVFNGRLPGELERESRSWFLISVGVKSAPSSREKKRDERSDSNSSNWKWGLVR
jgi:hypothetical protein